MSVSTLEMIHARLAALEDQAAIRDLITRIARGVDRYDGALLADCIWPDAVIDMGGEKPLSGAAFAAAIKPPTEPRPGRMHIVSNQHVRVDTDFAVSESQVMSCQDVLDHGQRRTRIRAGRYLDRFERRGGLWKLSARTMVDEWGRIDPVDQVPVQGRHLGGPAPSDPSYGSPFAMLAKGASGS
jgi:hypothetical protein